MEGISQHCNPSERWKPLPYIITHGRDGSYYQILLLKEYDDESHYPILKLRGDMKAMT